MNLFDGYTMVTRGPKMSFGEKIDRLREQLDAADAVVVGAGSGLSTAAGYVYTGERLETYFSDFVNVYGIPDMYSGGFYPYRTPEDFWGFWCRYIWVNRYAPIPSDLYERLFDVVKGKDYFVLTTNVDHCFQRSGFDKQRLFYTQGDYGLYQSSEPAGATAHKTYDNYESIREMILSEGYRIDDDGNLVVPDGVTVTMSVPTALVPICPDDGKPMTTNLRADEKFVEDAGWHAAADRYSAFIDGHRSGRVLYLELGVGMNTPVIIKYPFWKFTQDNPDAFYVCVNLDEAYCPRDIAKRSLCVDAGIDKVVEALIK